MNVQSVAGRSAGRPSLPPELAARVYAKALWKVTEVAALLGCTTRQIYALVGSGRLQVTRIGSRSTRIASDDLGAYLAKGRT